MIGASSNSVVKTVTTKFMLVHYLERCVLTTSGKQLPKWGFEQQEVTCNAKIKDSNAKWNIEYNKHLNRKSSKLIDLELIFA